MGHAVQHTAAQIEPDLHIAQFSHHRCIGARHGAAALPHARHSCQQRLRIRLLRGGKDIVHAARFLDHAFAHDHDAVSHFGDDAHVVGNQQDRGAVGRLQIAQQVQDLSLHGDIKRGRGLIRDQHVRLQRQGHRDHHALAHPPRQLVRELAHAAGGFGQAHSAQRL